MVRSSPRARRARSASTFAPRLGVFEFLEDRRLLSISALEETLPYIPPQRSVYQAGGYLTGPSSQPALILADNYLRTHAADLGLTPADISYTVESHYVTPTTGATTLLLQQTYDGLPVANATFKVTVAADGSLLSIGGGFVPGLGTTTQFVSDPAYDAATSVVWAAQGFGSGLQQFPQVVGLSAAGRTLVQSPDLSSTDIPAELRYVPLANGGVKLAWNVTVRDIDAGTQYNVNIDANTGEFISLYNQVANASYEVFAAPKRSPLDGARTIVTDPHIITPTPAIVPSPFGWHDTNGVPGAEFTVTRGNNTNTYLDRDFDFFPDLNAQPNGGAGLNFTGATVPLNLATQPDTYFNAAVTNMFYWVNTLHDVHYLYGFNEAAGNFQFNTYGRGGLGFDALQALVQAGALAGARNNAFYALAPDGEAPFIAMFLFSLTNPERDGDLDAEIIIHEYGHGVSTRLSGGDGLGLFTTQGGGMGEGWSDWWALMLTQKTAGETTAGRGVGNYALGLAENGVGVRRFRYDFDITDINLETFENFGIGTIKSIEVHDVGELWASALWDLNHLLIQKYGFEPNVYNSTSSAGNIKALHLVMNGLKIQPAAPTFIEARDAILLADQLLYGGANQFEIWTAFARRGLGQFAATADPNDVVLRTSFDVPANVFKPTVSIGADVSHAEGDAGTVDFVFPVSIAGFGINPVMVTYATANGTATGGVDYTPASGTLTFSPGGATTQNITIQASGDLDAEANETFFVQLSNPVNGDLGRAQARGTILNDDNALSINDVTVVEGNTGTTNAVFTISLSFPASNPATVGFATVGGTAISGSDFLNRNGTLSFAPGATAQTVTVPIIGDAAAEPTETFQVLLNNPTGARIDKASGVGTILDNDQAPALYVNDVQVKATSGDLLVAVFTVGLDAAAGQNVMVNFATADGDAKQAIHYQGQSGTLTFAPGVTTRQVSVPVMTSASPTANKSFFLNLSAPTNATLTDAQGIGTIIYAPEVPGETIIDNGDAGYSRTPGWTTVTNTLAYALDYDYSASGAGNNLATWSFTGLTPGSYQVFTRWVPFSNRATNASYTIRDGATLVGSAVVNQQLAPAGELSNGVTWQSLGFFQTTSGNLAVQLSNAANGFVIADAVRIVAGGIGAQEPEMNVAGASQSIARGDATPTVEEGTEFGAVNLGSASGPHTFTVNNTGNATLLLTGSPAVSISGPHAADFAVNLQPSAAIGPGGSTTFQITFQPSGAGLREATVSIANNDDDEHPYTFAVQGTGVAALVPLAHNASMPQDVNGDSRVSPHDALIVINAILSGRAGASAAPLALAASSEPTATPNYYVDVNGDGRLSTIDVLMVVNYILGRAAEAQAAPLAAPAVDEALVLLDDTAGEPTDDAGPRIELDPVAVAAASATPQSVDLLLVASSSEEPEDDDEFDPVLLAVGI